MYVNDPQFSTIIDYDVLRKGMHELYDCVYPDFNMLASMEASSRVFKDDPGYMVAAGASGLAYMMLIAAEEHELATSLKDCIFTLAWTEEHCGSDLLSVRTRATPVSDDPDEKNFHIQGNKWIINNSYHADYHLVVAKVDPEKNGPRSLSLFLVPHSSTSDWERIETHVLTNMVLTKFKIDGPGRLVGKVGHGLSIQQRMAMPSKYQATYSGIRLVHHAIPATIEHLSKKFIFGDNPVNFSNVFRQLHNLVLQAALIHFTFYRAVAFSDSPFLQFYGTMLKSFLLLRCNAVLSENLLIAGSKGFVKESVIGGNAIDSFVLPVFDGHYTINTLMTAKHASRYLNSTEKVDLEDRLQHLRTNLYKSGIGNQIDATTRTIRKPSFFDYADYVRQFELPLKLDAQALVNAGRSLLDEIKARELTGDAEYRYKIGSLLHWLESILPACELWKLTGEDAYLNAIVQQYNYTVTFINDMISEGAFETEFVLPIRSLPIPDVEDHTEFLMSLLDVESHLKTAVVGV